MIFVAGQIGWDETETIVSHDFVDQVRQALTNTFKVLAEGGAGPENIVRMTWFVTDKLEYLASRQRIGEVYREIMGSNYPTMSLLVVKDLLEEGAKVEIETTAVVE